MDPLDGVARRTGPVTMTFSDGTVAPHTVKVHDRPGGKSMPSTDRRKKSPGLTVRGFAIHVQGSELHGQSELRY